MVLAPIKCPTCGGIYQAPLTQPPQLTTLVGLGSAIPGEPSETFNRLGEGLSYDGRFVGFWGAWATATKTLLLDCRTEGNQGRIEFCEEQFPNGFETEVPVHQGIFVHDTRTGQTQMVARTGDDFDDFVFWNFSGRVPGNEGEDDGELARWRSSAFVAVSSRGSSVWTAFKARTGEIDPSENTYVDPLDGIYVSRKPGNSPLMTVVDTLTPGQNLDPEAPADSLVTELGIERDGFRGRWLVITARMGEEGSEEEDSMAGIYLTKP